MRNTLLSASILSGLALLGLAAEAQAKDVYLAAVRTCITPAGAGAGNCAVAASPSSTDPVPVWSLMTITPAEFAAKALSTTPLSSATVPGPLLNADASGGLTIHLLNLLPVPTSLIIPGQPAALAPVWFDPITGNQTGAGSRPAGDVTSRVRSLNTETAANATGTYTWSTLKPGSYIYESATHQGIQVQMGLHGGLMVAEGTTSTGETSATAYGVTYNQQVATYLTEIDAAMHRTVDASPSHDAVPAGSAAGTKVSPLNYSPNIFLTTQTSLTPDFTAMPVNNGHSQIIVAKPTLMRFFNGTLRTHVQMVQDENMAIIAEDGNAYRYPKAQYSAFLDASKTKDALMTPVSLETIAVYDHMLNTGNVGNTQQGMLAFLDIASPSTPTIGNVSFTEPGGAAFTAPAPGLLAKAVSNDNQPLTAVIVTQPSSGTVTVGTGGAFTYTPKANSTATTDAFAFKATELVGGTTFSSKQATASITFTAPKPVANGDSYAATTGQTLTVAAPGVLSNDTGTGITAALGTTTTHGTLSLAATGGFTYTPTGTYTGTDSFTYTATNTAGTSAPATATITVAAAAVTPVAKADTATVTHGTTNTVVVPVLANDTGATGFKSVNLVGTPSRGSAKVNTADGTITYTAPALKGTGLATFKYTFTNAAGVVSNTATVTVTVN